MGTMRTERTNSFLTRDASGRRFRVNEFTQYDVGQTTSGPYKIAGSKSLMLDDGTPVNHEGPGRYRAIGADEIELFSDAPLVD